MTVTPVERSRGERSRSPSAWRHRLPVLVLALVGCGISTYLTLYQWRATSAVWDPVFGSHSSERVLTSALSRALPIPDATLGAVAYLVEAAATLIGDDHRWERRPQVVLVYGLILAALALTSCALVLSQLLVVRALCALCLASAAVSILNAALGRPEVTAALRRFPARAPA